MRVERIVASASADVPVATLSVSARELKALWALLGSYTGIQAENALGVGDAFPSISREARYKLFTDIFHALHAAKKEFGL